jgi:peptidase C25-like protein
MSWPITKRRLLISFAAAFKPHQMNPRARTYRIVSKRQENQWILPRSIQITLLILSVSVSLIIVHRVLAAQVTIDDSPFNDILSAHNGSSPTVVFTSNDTGYAFYIDGTVPNDGSCVYSKTINGGVSWGAPVIVDAQTDCIKIAVWYDRWTPGDGGADIHILTADSSVDDLFYRRLDTSTDIFTPVGAPINASTASGQGGSFSASENVPSITKATNGVLYMGIQDDLDSYVIRCSTACQTASNWTEAGTSPFDTGAGAEDWLILMPLSGLSAGDIIAIRWDISADAIDSKVYHGSLITPFWDAAWLPVDSAVNNATYEGHYGATLNRTTGTIYLAYAGDVGTLGANDDVRTASYNGTWTSKTNVLTDDTRGVTGVKIATKQSTDTIYVVYTARTIAGDDTTGNVYYKRSTDAMTTWGTESAPLNTTPGDMFGARVNIMSDERIYATWVDVNVADFYGNTVADLSPTAIEMADFSATSTDKGVLLEWRTGYEVDNLGFNLYREKNGRRVLVNPSIIAGSAFTVGARMAMTAGDSYTWLDPNGSSDSVYYLEDLDLDGASTMHRAVVPTPETSSIPGSPRRVKSPEYERALLLNELNNRALAQTAANNSQRGWATPLRSAETSTAQSSLPSMFGNDDSATPSRRMPALERSAGSLRMPEPFSKAATTHLTSVEQQKILAGVPALKLAVRSDGWYRVAQPALVAAGLDPNADMRNLQIFADGIEVPIKINSSNTSGPLTAGDSIEFYGVALNTPSTDARQYWLISGSTAGNRISPQSLKVPGPIGGLRNFEYTVERRERLIYISGLLNGDSENFFGRVINSTPVSQTLSIRHMDEDDTTTPQLEVALQGAVLQDHAVKVILNGTEVGTMNFSGFSNKVTRFPLTAGVLREGENTVTLQRTNGISLVDYLRLTYAHTYEAENNQLQFTVRGRARVSGFSVPGVVLVDITDPNAVSLFNPKIEKTRGGYAFSVNTPDTRTFLALADQSAGQPSEIRRNEPSNWNASTQGADLVIITPGSFRDSVEPLAQLRRSQGLSVAVVDVEDVYDEFSFGAPTPRAIRDFLEWAGANWAKAPRFVLLAGDGSYDPRNYLSNTEKDLVPVHSIDTAVMETVSDDWFVDFDDDGIGEMAIGRLPARTPAELNTMISKIVGYLPSNAMQSALMVADKTDAKTNFDFEAATNELGALLPTGIGTQKIFRGDNPTSTVHDQIVNAINQGPYVVNFMGHGSVEVWTGGPILSTTDASAYQNGTRLPVFLMMTCLNAYYQNPSRESLAESLLRANTGGAVAVWASSGMTEPRPQFDVSRAMYKQLFGNEPITLGEAIRKAKIGSADRDVSRTWIFLGDPSMSIR